MQQGMIWPCMKGSGTSVQAIVHDNVNDCNAGQQFYSWNCILLSHDMDGTDHVYSHIHVFICAREAAADSKIRVHIILLVIDTYMIRLSSVAFQQSDLLTHSENQACWFTNTSHHTWIRWKCPINWRQTMLVSSILFRNSKQSNLFIDVLFKYRFLNSIWTDN